MRNTHEIRNYFHSNRLNTRLICNICEANYYLKSNLTNLKNHFKNHHKDEYQKILEKNKKKQKEITKQKERNTLTEQINITKYYPSIQVEDSDITEYETEEIVTSRKIRLQPEIENNELVVEREIKRP